MASVEDLTSTIFDLKALIARIEAQVPSSGEGASSPADAILSELKAEVVRMERALRAITANEG